MRTNVKRFVFITVVLFATLLLSLSSCNAECKHRKMTESTVTPSCGSRGYTVFSCTKCSFSFESDYVSPSPHVLKDTVIDSDCTQGGYVLHECTLCDYSYSSDFTSSKTHSISTSVISPSCTLAGFTLKECVSCDFEERTDFVSALAHDLDKTVVKPSCEKEGYTQYSCKNCTFKYTADHVSALLHSYISETLPPTCSAEGYTQKTCSVCKNKIKTNLVPPKEHEYTDTRIRATSSQNGYTLHDCKNCDYSYKTDYEYSYAVFTGAYCENNEVLAKGVDVSYYNGSVNWGSAKSAGIDFVILRAGSSVSGKDTMFDSNYTAARVAGLDIGVYYYVEATSVNEILIHANALKTILKDKKFEYPIYLDIEKDALGEALGKELLTQMCTAFIEDLQADGYFAALYTNNNWLENFYDKKTVTSEYDIWYARYPSENVVDPPVWKLEKYGPTMGMWQYTDDGVINGLTSDIPFDINLAYKDYPTIIKRFGYNGY